MNLDDKHFYVFCYTQSINPTEKSWKLYEAFFKPEYKYIDEIYNDIKSVLDFDLEAHALELYPTLVKGTYSLNENGTDITLKKYTPYTTNSDYDSKLYKLSWQHKDGLKDDDSIIPDLMFKNYFIILYDIKSKINDLKQYVGTIVRKNPLTYRQLFKLPVISSTNTISDDIYDQFDFQDVISIETDTTCIKDFERNLVFTDNSFRDGLTIEFCTYKGKPLLVTVIYDYPDFEIYNEHSILDKDLYQQFKDHVYSLCEKLYENSFNTVQEDSEFRLNNLTLKGKCF